MGQVLRAYGLLVVSLLHSSAAAALEGGGFYPSPELIEQSGPVAVEALSDVTAGSWPERISSRIIQRLPERVRRAFKGFRTLSRFEFAQRLGTLLDQLEGAIVAGTTEGALSRTEMEALERLVREFERELTLLHNGRIPHLEQRLAMLDEELFNTTTRRDTVVKLDGAVVMGVTGGGGCAGCAIASGVATGPFFAGPVFGDALGAVLIPTNRGNVSFVTRTTLNLRATFSGQDNLRIRMRGVTGLDISAALPGIASGIGVLIFSGGPTGTSFDGSTADVRVNGSSGFTIDELRYQFPVFGDRFRLFVGPRLEISEYIDTSSFANNEEIDFTGGLTTNNPLITFVFFGPGAGFEWDVTDAVTLRGIYLANNGGAATGNPRTDISTYGVPYGAYGAGGLFGGETALVTEAEVRLGPAATLKAQFGRLIDQGGILGALTVPNLIYNSATDAWGFNGEWAVTPHFALFGRYGFGTIFVNPLPGSGVSFAPIALNTWQVGVTFIGLGGEGNALGLTVAQPLRAYSGSVRGLVGPGEFTGLVPGGTEYDVSLYYRIQINDRLSLTPLVQFIGEPVNSLLSNGLTVGTMRAVFSF